MQKADIQIFKEDDIYSISLFTLYQLTAIPEYSTVSELPYVIDRKSLLRLCQYYGGMTLKIPTLQELSSMLNLILLYQYINIENKTFNESASLLGYDESQLYMLKINYNKLVEIMNKYDIKPRNKFD